eukprot:TRINITY_DN58657_c0_g1_i1.p1 TRINITY_DN58657_c0_g1~~TRINITY_DN58657_c0_g1_i1.p1  ORF type:complete len:592 (+),score=111.27 TRINITY_DN58657_c0_g1_i1:61-1836(+)
MLEISAEGSLPTHLRHALGVYSAQIPDAELPYQTHANIYHVIALRELQRCYHQEGGSWALYWDEGVLGADPGWWLAETGNKFGVNGLLWAAGTRHEVPEQGWQLRSELGIYEDMPLRVRSLDVSHKHEPNQACVSTFLPAREFHIEKAEEVKREQRAAAGRLAAAALLGGHAQGLLAAIFSAWSWAQRREAQQRMEDRLQLLKTKSSEKETARAAAVQQAALGLLGSNDEAMMAVFWSAWARATYLGMLERVKTTNGKSPETDAGCCMGLWKVVVEACFGLQALHDKLEVERKRNDVTERQFSEFMGTLSKGARTAMSLLAGSSYKKLLLDTYSAWVQLHREFQFRKTDEVKRERVAAAGRNAAAALLRGHTRGLLAASFSAWSREQRRGAQQLTEDRLQLLQAKSAEREIARAAAMQQAALGLLGNNGEAMLAVVWSAWVRARHLGMLDRTKAVDAARKSAASAFAHRAATAMLGCGRQAMLAELFSAWVRASYLQTMQRMQAHLTTSLRARNAQSVANSPEDLQDETDDWVRAQLDLAPSEPPKVTFPGPGSMRPPKGHSGSAMHRAVAEDSQDEADDWIVSSFGCAGR